MENQIKFTMHKAYSPEEKKQRVLEIWARLEMRVMSTEKLTGQMTYRDEQYKTYDIDKTHYNVDIKITADRGLRDKEYFLTAVLPIWDFLADDKYNFVRIGLPNWLKNYSDKNFGTIIGRRYVRFPIDKIDDASRLIDNLSVVILPLSPWPVADYVLFNKEEEVTSEKDATFKELLGGNCGIIKPWDYKNGHVEHWLFVPKKNL